MSADLPIENARSLVARIAAAERWGRVTDRTTETQPARNGLRAKYARQIDPDGQLSPDQLEIRVDSLMHAHMLRMSLAAKRARQTKAGRDSVSLRDSRAATSERGSSDA